MPGTTRSPGLRQSHPLPLGHSWDSHGPFFHGLSECESSLPQCLISRSYMSPEGHHVTGRAQFQATWSIPTGAYHSDGSALAWNSLPVPQSHGPSSKAWDRAPKSHLHRGKSLGPYQQALTPPCTWPNCWPGGLTPGQNQRCGVVSASPTGLEGSRDPRLPRLLHTAPPRKSLSWSWSEGGGLEPHGVHPAADPEVH